MENKKKLLLHVCCAPCLLGCLDKLENMDVTVFFYNPNIQPFEEYIKRLDALKDVLKNYDNIKLIEGDYDLNFTLKSKGLETEKEGGIRCEMCIELRLEQTAIYAMEHKFDCFDSTLSVSPHKNFPFILKTGKALEEKTQVEFLGNNFKKQNGFLNSTKKSKELNVYRQNYCGCIFSKREF